MRFKAALIAAVFSFPYAAQAQFEPLAFAMCKKITTDIARLKCFDEIGAVATKDKAAESEPVSDKWTLTEDRSPIDDSPQILAVLKSTEASAYLALRCRERKTEAQIIPVSFFATDVGNYSSVLVRIDDGPAASSNWYQATSGGSVFSPNAIQFIRLLPDGGKLFVRVNGMSGRQLDATFKLIDISTVKTKIEETCNWSTPKAAKLPAPLKPSTSK